MKAKVTKKKKKETDWENTLKFYHTFCVFVNDLMMYFIYSKYELTVDINICSKRDNSTIWKRPDFLSISICQIHVTYQLICLSNS